MRREGGSREERNWEQGDDNRNGKKGKYRKGEKFAPTAQGIDTPVSMDGEDSVCCKDRYHFKNCKTLKGLCTLQYSYITQVHKQQNSTTSWRPSPSVMAQVAHYQSIFQIYSKFCETSSPVSEILFELLMTVRFR